MTQEKEATAVSTTFPDITLKELEKQQEDRKDDALPKGLKEEVITVILPSGATTPTTATPEVEQIPEIKKRGRKKKYETEEEAKRVAQEQRKNYRIREKEKIEQKRLLRSMLDNIPMLTMKLFESNAVIYNLIMGEEPKEHLFELPHDIYEKAVAFLHPIKKKLSIIQDLRSESVTETKDTPTQQAESPTDSAPKGLNKE